MHQMECLRMSPETGDGDQLLEPVNLLSRKAGPSNAQQKCVGCSGPRCFFELCLTPGCGTAQAVSETICNRQDGPAALKFERVLLLLYFAAFPLGFRLLRGLKKSYHQGGNCPWEAGVKEKQCHSQSFSGARLVLRIACWRRLSCAWGRS